MSGPRVRIICVGNRLSPLDRAGPLVYDRLRSRELPVGIDVIDGGLGGLSLLGLLEDVERVVFVDAATGFEGGDEVLTLSVAEATRHAGESFGHDGGLAYLLQVAPAVMAGPPPEMLLVGVAGPPLENRVERAAEQALAVAEHGVVSR